MTEPATTGPSDATEGSESATTKPLRYRRILLKLSGEALLGDRQYGVDPAVCVFIARQVAEIHGLGSEENAKAWELLLERIEQIEDARSDLSVPGAEKIE